MKRTLIGVSLLCIGAATFISACSSNKSTGVSRVTGWDYNDPRLGGFDVANYPGQQTGPGLTFVEGGRFTMGQIEEDLTIERNNIPRTVSVSSFYMDETEVANVHYREYIYWLQRSYASDYPFEVANALPDSNAWRRGLSYNEPLVRYYFRHAAYNYYPVVGVNWFQATDFAKWRSERVNEQILLKNGMLKKNPNQVNEDVFTTDTYVAGQYEGLAGPRRKRDLDPSGSGRRSITFSDGFNSIDEIVKYAGEIGLRKIAITDHSQASLDYYKIARKTFRAIINRWKNVYNNVEVIFGVEGDILNDEGDVCVDIDGFKSDFVILRFPYLR